MQRMLIFRFLQTMAKPVKYLFFFLALSVLMPGCGPGSEADGIWLSGEVMQGTAARIVLNFIDTSGVKPVDSLKLKKDGSFSFRIKPGEGGFYFLRAGKEQSGMLVLFPGDAVTVKMGGNAKPAISGGKEAEEYSRFFSAAQNGMNKIDSLAEFIQNNRHRKDFLQLKNRADSAYTAIVGAIKSEAAGYLEKHPDYLSLLPALNLRLRQAPLFDELTDTRLFLYTDSTLNLHFPDNRYVIQNRQRIGRLRQIIDYEEEARNILKPGTPTPPISLPGTNEAILTPASTGTPFTLIYFWAPADAASRKTNHELKTLYEQFRPMGLSVYAVSLEPSTDRWKAAVTLDKLWWVNVNDTMGRNSSVAAAYMAERLPVFVLIDRRQNIVDRYISIQALEHGLSEIMAKPRK